MKVCAVIRYIKHPGKEFEEMDSLMAIYSTKELADRILYYEDGDDAISYDIEAHEIDAGPEYVP